MNETIVHALLEINRRFYQDYAESFASTRRRIQDGVRHLVQDLPDGRYLDLGCGSGALAQYWTRPRLDGTYRRGLYMGVDFSAGLLAEARRELPPELPSGLGVAFHQRDLMAPDWHTDIEGTPFDELFAFAVLHHLPGDNHRIDFLNQARSLVKPGTGFILSVWQIQHSPKLMARHQPWSDAGLQDDQVEAGDVLLDWRQSSKGSPQSAGLRYVHMFNEADLAGLAVQTGWKVESTAYHDGHTGNLGLYQVWRAV
ncbi:MAG: class I SAM-dependent methyltransferase [Leptolinea sp.]